MNVRKFARPARGAVVLTLALVFALASVMTASAADPIPDYDFATPVFDLAVQPDQSLLVADAGFGFDGVASPNAGVVEMRKGTASLVVHLPNVSGVAPVGVGVMYAVTGEGLPDSGWKVYRLAGKNVEVVADLLAYEEAVNPDATEEVHSNPFDIAAINGEQVLVADAGGNDLLVVGKDGSIDWVASFPQEMVPSATIKSLIGCPNVPPFLAFVCEMPELVPAQPVPTSVVIGPDGAYYAGELKGFPGPVNESRIWRIEPGSRHVVCGTDPGCTLYKDGGFTGIVDLSVGPDGTLYVTEIDEASSVAVELGLFLGLPILQGGTVSACNVFTGACDVVATGLNIPLATAALKDGTLYAVVNGLIPGAAEIITLP